MKRGCSSLIFEALYVFLKEGRRVRGERLAHSTHYGGEEY